MSKRLLSGVSLLLLLSAGNPAGSSAQRCPTSSKIFAFLHVNIISMNREEELPDQTLIVCGGRITGFGPAESVPVPARAQPIDGSGKYLIPGLTDAHVHLLSPVEFRLYLANGVTTVFNLNGRPAHLRWRKEIATGARLGPNIFTTGPMFDRPRSATEDVRLVDEQAKAGYDAIKVYNQVSSEEYPALIAEAKRRKLLLMGHVARGPDFERTLEAGQSIAHLEEFLYTYFNPQRDDRNLNIVFDESKIAGVAKKTAEAGIYVIPTLNMYVTIVEQATELDTFLRNPNLKYVAPWTLSQYQPNANLYRKNFPPSSHEWLRKSLAFQRRLVKALFDAGVPLLAGTDATEVGPLPGFGLHDELQELVRDGLTPFQALQAATTNASRYFGRVGEFGVVQSGGRADLILLTQNPLADIANTRKIAGVMVGGRWLSHADLKKRLERVPAIYRNQEIEVEYALKNEPAKAKRFLEENDPFDRVGRVVRHD